MSLTDSAVPTLSTLFNIIKAVNDSSSTSNSSSDSFVSRNTTYISSSSSTYTNILGINSTTTPPPPIHQCTSFAAQSVTHGVPESKIITILVMLVLFSVFGCIGNGLVLYVFSKKSDRVTSTIFILTLAWTDFFTCLIFMPFTVVYISLDSRLHLDFFCKLYNFLSTCSVPLSAFIMVAIAVDRYFSICHPFVQMVTPRRARGAIVSLVLVAFTLGSITACIYTTHRTVTIADVNSSMYINETVNFDIHFKTDHVTGQISPTSSSSYVTEVPKLFVEKRHQNVSNYTNDWDSNHTRGRSFEECPQEDVDGLCVISDDILSYRFTEMYQKVYISFYAISLLAVFSLYFLIYRSVAERRAWRRKQKSWSHSPMTMTGAVTIEADNGNKFNDVYVGDGENLELSPQNMSTGSVHLDPKDNDVADVSSQSIIKASSSRKVIATGTVKPICSHENGLDSCQSNYSSADKKINRERRDFNFLANIRTAIMLFVVTLVFIVSFLPAWLMATNLIRFEIIVFYMHFVYNIANPIIYAFMNQSFRKEIRKVFQRGTHIFKGG